MKKFEKIKQCYNDLLDLKLKILDSMLYNESTFQDDPERLKLINDLLSDSLKKVNDIFDLFSLIMTAMVFAYEI